jgi:Uma2 family endonuclease
MTQARTRFATFEEYYEWSNDCADNVRYELIDGELIELPPESPENDFIPQRLFWLLALARIVPQSLIRPHTCEVQVPVLEPKDSAMRYPDLVILRPEHLVLMGRRLTIKLDMPSPQLVAEVLSPGKQNRQRDLVRKRAQYAARCIPEYWLIDPENQTVTVLMLQSGDYVQTGVFGGEQRVISPSFPALQLIAAEIFVTGI